MPESNSDPAKLQLNMLKPTYWGTWFLLALLWLLQWLPRRWVMAIGVWVGDQTRKRNSKRRHIAKVNIDLCFPELNEAERDQLLVDHFHHYGCGLVDLGLIMMASVERIERFSEVVGRDNLVGHESGQRIILVSFHTTTLDMCSSSMLAHIDVVSMMKRDKNPVLNRFLYRARTRYNKLEIFMRDEGVRGVMKGLLQGKVCYLIPDEDFGALDNSVFAPFFNQPRSTLTTVSRLAEKTNAIVVPAICRLNIETGRYTTEVAPPLSNFPSGDQVNDATRINATMEHLIRLSPEQYLWTFRWFRNRPDGLTDPYQYPTDKIRQQVHR